MTFTENETFDCIKPCIHSQPILLGSRLQTLAVGSTISGAQFYRKIDNRFYSPRQKASPERRDYIKFKANLEISDT